MISRLTCTSAGIFLTAAFGLAPAAPEPATASTPRPDRTNFTETLKVTTRPDAMADEVEKQVRFEMIYVPGGEFTMGSPNDEPGREPNEGPQHRVKVGAFWMGKCEVTWDEFDLFCTDERFPSSHDAQQRKLGPDAVTRPSPSYVDETYDHGREGHPVLCITHHAAMVYCLWLQKKTGKAYRLPTEAEWEYAARSGKESAYFFGNVPKELAEYAWFRDNSPDEDHPRGTTHKVGAKKPNPFGLHDLYGNVWEWTLDQYDPKAYESRANKLTLRPVTVPTAQRWSHVVRGGSWADRPDRCRSAARRISDKSWQKWDPAEPPSIWWLTRMDVVGFRVVLAEHEQTELLKLMPKVTPNSKD